jgi:hypothetical protein
MSTMAMTIELSVVSMMTLATVVSDVYDGLTLKQVLSLMAMTTVMSMKSDMVGCPRWL